MKNRHAFTLVELLAVIAIIGVLVGLLLPAVQSARESGRQSRCKNNIKQLGLAALNYESTKGTLPPQGFPWQLAVLMNQGTVMTYGNQVSFLVWLLPFVEQQTLGDQAVAQVVASGGLWSGPFATKVPVFLCPSEQNQGAGPLGGGCTNYRCNKGDIGTPDGAASRGPMGIGAQKVNGVYSGNLAVRVKQITDGLSSTVMLGEAVIGTQATSLAAKAGIGKLGALDGSTAPATCWALVSGDQYSTTITDTRYQPGSMWGRSWYDTYTSLYTNAAPNTPRCVADYDWNAFINPASSYHPGGVFVAMCDASVRFVSDTIDAGDPTAPQVNNQGTTANAWQYTKASMRGVWGAVGTISGGETVRLE
jgi:prepilin-type N-terminal cleavage/methylation domain-containing protein